MMLNSVKKVKSCVAEKMCRYKKRLKRRESCPHVIFFYAGKETKGNLMEYENEASMNILINDILHSSLQFLDLISTSGKWDQKSIETPIMLKEG